MKTIEQIISDVIVAEGGYSNDPNDAGGETMYGITASVARANGYTGAMKDMPINVAVLIYHKRYVEDPGFDRVAIRNMAIACELIDTGVNMGQLVAGKFLQQCLNALNDNEKLYADLIVDGGVGLSTLNALDAYLSHRHQDGEKVMLTALNCLQGARYITITEARPANESFCYGWLRNRVILGA